MEFEDIIYENRNHMAWVTVNRPQRLNAFDFKTISKLGAAFEDVGLFSREEEARLSPLAP